jgi:hypothetical protein
MEAFEVSKDRFWKDTMANVQRNPSTELADYLPYLTRAEFLPPAHREVLRDAIHDKTNPKRPKLPPDVASTVRLCKVDLSDLWRQYEGIREDNPFADPEDVIVEEHWFGIDKKLVSQTPEAYARMMKEYVDGTKIIDAAAQKPNATAASVAKEYFDYIAPKRKLQIKEQIKMGGPQ